MREYLIAPRSRSSHHSSVVPTDSYLDGDDEHDDVDQASHSLIYEMKIK